MTLSRSTRLAAATSLASAMMVLQFAVIRWSPVELPVRIVLPATVALVPAALWPLRHRIGVWVMFVGLAANLAPIIANGGLMPIEYHTVAHAVGAERAASYETGAWIEGSKDVLVAPGKGRLTALGDGIIIRLGPARGFAASPGDLVIFAGFLVLVAESSVAWQRGVRGSDASVDRAPQRAEGSATTPP